MGKLRQIRVKAICRRISLLDGFRERLEDDPVELGRDARREGRRGRHVAALDPAGQIDRRGAVEEAAAGAELPEARGERVDVGPPVEVPAGDLLGGDVAERAAHLARRGARDPARRPGNAEVEQLYLAVDRQHDVGRTDVAVDHAERVAVAVAASVRVRERLADAEDDVERHLERDALAQLASAIQDRAQIAAVNVLVGDVVRARDVADVDHLGDPRVVEEAADARLVVQRLGHLAIERGAGRKSLQGHEATAAREGPEHLAQRADADALGELVRAKSLEVSHERPF